MQGIDTVEIGDAAVRGAFLLVVIAKQQTALHLAADAAQRRGRQHPFGRATDAQIDVDPALRPGGGDDPADVTVGYQLDARPGLAHVGDEFGMARPVQDAGDQVEDVAFLRLGQVFEVLARLLVQIDQLVGKTASDRDLVHIDVGRVEETALRPHRDHGQRILAALGGDRRPFQRVEGDIELRTLPGADLLADEQHGRLVPLALADHHRAVDVEAVQGPSHGLDRGLIGRPFVTPADQAGSRQGRRFGHPHRLQPQVAVYR